MLTKDITHKISKCSGNQKKNCVLTLCHTPQELTNSLLNSDTSVGCREPMCICGMSMLFIKCQIIMVATMPKRSIYCQAKRVGRWRRFLSFATVALLLSKNNVTMFAEVKLNFKIDAHLQCFHQNTSKPRRLTTPLSSCLFLVYVCIQTMSEECRCREFICCLLQRVLGTWIH